MSDDLRAVLQSVAFGTDARITPGDRMRAIEQLRDLPNAGAAAESLTPEQVLEEVESFADAMPGIVACARVAAGEHPLDVVEAPVEVDDLREVIVLQEQVIGLLELRLAERERALQRLSVQRLLPAAPGRLV